MNIIVRQVKRKYSWTQQHTDSVAREYFKFLNLRKNNAKLSPSDDVDRFWHQHILNTRHYREFCFRHLGKFLDHNPEDANDQVARSKRLRKTMNMYRDVYKQAPPSSIWKPKPNYTYAKFIYNFDIYNDEGKFLGKSPRKNSGYKYDGKTLKIRAYGTVKDLKKYIGEMTRHDWIAVLLYPSYSAYRTASSNGMNNEYSLDKYLSELPSNITVVLEEMSQNGYC